MTRRTMGDREFEEYFDGGGDTTAFMVEGSVRQPDKSNEQKRVNFNFPAWLVEAIDKEARHLAIPRQSVVITWLAERARQENLTA